MKILAIFNTFVFDDGLFFKILMELFRKNNFKLIILLISGSDSIINSILF